MSDSSRIPEYKNSCTRSGTAESLSHVRKLSILTGARPATFDVYELNYWVRDDSRWILIAIVSLLSLKSLRMILQLSLTLSELFSQFF